MISCAGSAIDMSKAIPLLRLPAEIYARSRSGLYGGPKCKRHDSLKDTRLCVYLYAWRLRLDLCLATSHVCIFLCIQCLKWRYLFLLSMQMCSL